MHRYKLDELAAKAGVSPRTVRYYVQRGLLPGPEFRGKDTTYGPGHLLRLRVIQRLQERFLPLDAISVALQGKTDGELEQLLRAKTPEPPARSEPGPRPVPPGRAYEAWELAPGLVVGLARDAPAPSRALAEKIFELASSQSRGE